MIFIGVIVLKMTTDIASNLKREHGSNWLRKVPWSGIIFVFIIAASCIVAGYKSLSELIHR